MSEGSTNLPPGRMTYPLKLSPRAVWVSLRLREITIFKTIEDVLIETWLTYDMCFKKNAQREILFVKHKGGRAMPVQLVQVEARIDFPPEADSELGLVLVLAVTPEDIDRYEEYRTRAGAQSVSAYVENALFFYYTLAVRHLIGDTFYWRKPGEKDLVLATLFGSKSVEGR